MTDLRHHVAVDHGQGAVADDVPLDVIETWHDLEHLPGRSHTGHAHDEFSARRHRVRLVTA